MLPLDSTLLLTQGSPLSVGAVLAYLRPEHGIYTGICRSQRGAFPLIGQVHYTGGDRSAHVSFVLPESGVDPSDQVDLLEGLAAQAGIWGAFNLLADVDELSPAFPGLRKAGFTVYGWQRIWQLPFKGENGSSSAEQWQNATPADEIPLRNLVHQLVPPLAQAADPFPTHRSQGLVSYQSGELMAYVEGTFGPSGIFLFPLVHPSVEYVADLIKGLERHLHPLLMRPVYMAVRSYQSWLETALEKLEWQVAPRQALMVKRLAIAQPVAATVRQAVIEHSPAPLVHHFTGNKE
jgi:hypothetical protein